MQPEYFIERKKLKQHLFNWKMLCIVLIAALGTAAKFIFFDDRSIGTNKNHEYIATVYIDGAILDDKKRNENLRKIVDNNQIKALIVYINSPGGSAPSSEELYNLLRKIAVKKPVVAVMNSLAASGGYMIAIAADYIVAHNSTITGSIGVVWQNLEVTNLAEKIGITFNNFKSSPLKAAPNPTEKITPEVEEASMSLIKDTYDYFVELVSQRRKLPKAQVIKIADGRIYTGRQAYDLKLVDRLGSTDEALAWLHDEKKIDKSLKLKEVELKPKPLISKILGEDFEQRIYNSLMNYTGLLAQ
jgi:protease-4